jgi:hypothetical protein
MATTDHRVLLRFRKGGTEDTDGDGRLRLAFSIPAGAAGARPAATNLLARSEPVSACHARGAVSFRQACVAAAWI